MENIENNLELIKKLEQLESKFNLTGQNLLDNLEGLLQKNYLKYWDYIHLDTLLSLQNPKTDFPDEMIFIMYHQITELYFKLILWEIDQIGKQENQVSTFFLNKISRINRYIEHLTHSFSIMTDGMDVQQFRQFRMALLPASGFQSMQFRKIEVCSTDFVNLINKDFQNELTKKARVEEVYPFLYWKNGATEEDTGKETITSLHFQEKYTEELTKVANEYREKNIWQCYLKLPKNDQDRNLPLIIKELRKFDILMNVDWRLAHYKSAIRYLKQGRKAVNATGGTNWQQYLPPRFQKTYFFPELLSEEEKQDWGKRWILTQLDE